MVVRCASLDEVRSNIDRIDREIVGLIAERGEYVEQAARFKASPSAVFDKTRFDQILARVRSLAEEAGTSPEVVESVYRSMVMGFTEWEQGLVRDRE
jgi:isochorismate pyruvate lyase